MILKCPKCGRTQEVSEKAWRISQDGLPTGLPWMPMAAVHHFTCCNHIDMVPANV